MMGRPPKPKAELKNATLRVRMTKSERSRLDKAAKLQGKDVSAWAREALLAMAEKTLQDAPKRSKKT